MNNANPASCRRAVGTLSVLLCLGLTVSLNPGKVVAAAETPSPDQIFAKVDEHIITKAQFSQALASGVRTKYYHGKIPENEQASFQREVARDLIDRTLLLRHARREGIQADPDWVARRLATIEERASRSPQWAKHRDTMLGLVREQLRQDSVIALVEEKVRHTDTPDEAELRRFYDDNPDLFTEPERFRISAILLRVDPSSPTSVWDAAMDEASAIVQRLRAGAPFAELASLHSSDGSAKNGGDMGYLHRGMLGGPAQKAVDEATVGEITDPVKLLEGVAIFRVDDRPPARLREYQEVRTRAAALWQRRTSDEGWKQFLARLRDSADIQVMDSHLLQALDGDTAHK
jgi:hypothetical protein